MLRATPPARGASTRATRRAPPASLRRGRSTGPVRRRTRRAGRRGAGAVAGSIRVAVTKAEPERLQEDLDVEAERPALDVVEVVLDTLFDGRVAAPAVDLRPARDAGLHLVPEHVARDPLAELLDERGSLGPRTDEAHLT